MERMLSEEQMEMLLEEMGYEFRDEEGIPDSTLVIDFAIELGFEPFMVDGDLIRFVKEEE